MKRIILVLSLLLLFYQISLSQDVPRFISYQGVLVNSEGKPITESKSVKIKISLFNTLVGGIPLDSREYDVQIIGGLFSTQIFIPSNIDLNQQLWLELEAYNQKYPRIKLNASLYALNIPDGIVTNRKLADNAVTSTKIQDYSITEKKLSPNSVGKEHLQMKSVTHLSIDDNSIYNDHLTSDCISSDKIRVSAIRSRELNDVLEFRHFILTLNENATPMKTYAYFGDLYSPSSGYAGYGLAIFPKDGVNPGWSTGQSVCGFRTDGVVYGTSKSFIVDDPNDSTRKIKYTCIEGPEAAMYYRGKGKLNNGKAYVELPEHFKVLVNDTTLTFSLTPHSSTSKGLAIESVTKNGFEVKELFNGAGNYEFSFVIYGIRKGYENYEVYIDKSSFPSPIINRNDQNLQNK